jgi:lysine-specific histone demethylase 1
MFTGGEHADVLERCTDDEVAAWAEGVIRSYFSPRQQQRNLQKPIPVPIRVERTRWRADEDSFGCYSYIPVGGSPTSNSTSPSISASPVDQLELSRTLWGRVFWAGEHTHLDQYGSVHGAWNSGLREAEKILVKLENSETE